MSSSGRKLTIVALFPQQSRLEAGAPGKESESLVPSFFCDLTAFPTGPPHNESPLRHSRGDGAERGRDNLWAWCLPGGPQPQFGLHGAQGLYDGTDELFQGYVQEIGSSGDDFSIHPSGKGLVLPFF